MTYTFKYRLQSSPVARNDGTGIVDCTILAVVSTDGGAYATIPGYSRLIQLPYQELRVVMDMPDATGPQRTAKNNAFKVLLAERADLQLPSPSLNWSIGGMTAWMTANDGAATESGRLHTYITIKLG
jgi:hypothetical protein